MAKALVIFYGHEKEEMVDFICLEHRQNEVIFYSDEYKNYISAIVDTTKAFIKIYVENGTT